MVPSRYTWPSRTSASAKTTCRLSANSSATAISATASALRPGALMIGMPLAVAAARSTLLGSPRVEAIALSGRSNTGPLTRSTSTMSTSARSSAARAASCSSFQMRSGVWSSHGSWTTSSRRRSFSSPGPRSGEVTRARGRAGVTAPWCRNVTLVSYACELTAGIDIGTTSVKAVIADPHGRIVHAARVPHPVVIPSAVRFEHDADRAWRRGPRKALAALIGHRPAAVAVSAMVPSLTAVDRRGRPLTPGLLYGDERGRTGPVARRQDSDAGEVVGFLEWTAAAAPGAFGYWPAPAVANFALARVAGIDFGTAFSSQPLFGDSAWDAS